MQEFPLRKSLIRSRLWIGRLVDDECRYEAN